MSDHADDGGVSHPSSPQTTDELYWLICVREWDEASRRCRTHPQDARWKNEDKYGCLPIHWACRFRAPLGLIRQLHEAYGEGIRTTDILFRLPLHYACWRSSLEVIRYLHDQYPDGATEKDKYGKTPADYLEDNDKLSVEDRAAAQNILSNPPRPRTSPPRPTKPTTATSMTDDGGGDDASSGKDELTRVIEAMDAAVTAKAMAMADVARRSAQFVAADDAFKLADVAAEEAEAAACTAREALEEAQRRYDAANESAQRGRREADDACWNVARLKVKMMDVWENVERTNEAVENAVARKLDVERRVFAPDRDKLKPFFESTGHGSPRAAVPLSLAYTKWCTGDFSDGHRLGEGAFGVVYRGYDDVLQRRFAVKRIRYEMRSATNDEDVRATRRMLENELKVLNEFQHAHIARLYGYVLTENLQDEQILVYELASRGSLNSFFESEAKRSELPWQRRVLIALQVASAVRFLHEGGGDGAEGHFCYHRDVKSANVCLRADYSAVLIDCGLAKMIPKEESRAHGWTATTRSWGPPGTIEYMCPLYATGLRVSDRTDVFAFGMVLLELFTGRLQQSRPDGFYDRYVSKEGGGPGDPSLLVGDVDEQAGTWKDDAHEEYSGLALQCIRSLPNDRPTIREVFRRLGSIAQTHCYLDPEEVDEIQRGKQASSYECVLEIVEEVRAMQEEAIAKQDEVIAKQDESMAKHDETIAKQEVSIAKLDEAIAEQEVAIAKQDDMMAKQNETVSKQEEMNSSLKSIGEGVRFANVKIDSVLHHLQWMTAALTSVVRQESCQCPRLAILVPSGSCDRVSLRSPSTWLSKEVHLYFLCACDLTPVQNPVALTVNRNWLKRAMPLLKCGVFVLRAASAAGRASTGLPLDILPALASEALHLLDTGYQSIVGSEWQEDLESYCQSLVASGESRCSEAAVARGKVLTDEAYEVVAEKACQEGNKSWAREMELVASGRDGLVWIKRENKSRWMQLLGDS